MLLPVYVSSFQISMLEKTQALIQLIFIYKKEKQQKYDTVRY
jgi:hypothetical protein